MVTHGLEREGLFRLLHERFAPETVLYSGCFLHVTPSFWLRHVVYVDRNELARRFFEDSAGVARLVEGRRRAGRSAHVRFIDADYTQPLPLRHASFDLVLALYAPDVSRSTVQYLRHGGLLLSNDHGGDAAHAAADPRLELVGVVEEQRGRFTLRDEGLEQYLVPKPGGAGKGRQLGGRPEYVRPASYYLFKRRD